MDSREDLEFLRKTQKDLLGGIDTWVPDSARVWNYWLGGKDNFTVDREAAEEYARLFPGIFKLVHGQRAFGARAVRYLVAKGVRQFLVLGSGLPADENPHQVAQLLAPQCRVVCVDNDAMAVTHGEALLVSTPEGAIHQIDADLRDPGRILAETAQILDLGQPVAILMIAVLGHITDNDQARQIVRHLMDALPTGSYLALSDATDIHPDLVQAQQGYNASGAAPYRLRTPEQIEQFFDGLEQIEPGLVSPALWLPDLGHQAPSAVGALAGAAVKR
ncbi:SAM-dependent methyltransferase [Actinomadura hibisca]|uniref:SAM-dependent methyltransferase n=1 Tax=Actinomadura hibisca TaxID=68565 RepID=UPI000832C66A|nr:SAM-dependent methyltransferase [Actinomadura hibisca]